MTTNLTAILGGSSGGSWKSQTFTTSGTWVKPEGVEVVKIVMAGGGGGGGYWDSPGGNGGTSFFYAPIPVSAGGGWGACRADFSAWNETLINGWGGNGGGVSGGEIALIHLSGTILGGPPALLTKLNSGVVYPSAGGTQIKTHAGMGISSGNSISGAGGGAGSRRGGSVPGFGDSGVTGIWNINDDDFAEYGPGGGGGASFGNGGMGVGRPARNTTPTQATPGIFGAGGGGGAYIIANRTSFNFIGGPGGGGGEIVIRDVPVKDVSSVFVAIGAGGAPALQSATANFTWRGGITTVAPSAGGAGICQIFWS
jgi:fibronectin-binding autotransporter adhesin